MICPLSQPCKIYLLLPFPAHILSFPFCSLMHLSTEANVRRGFGFEISFYSTVYTSHKLQVSCNTLQKQYLEESTTACHNKSQLSLFLFFGKHAFLQAFEENVNDHGNLCQIAQRWIYFPLIKIGRARHWVNPAGVPVGMIYISLSQ